MIIYFQAQRAEINNFCPENLIIGGSWAEGIGQTELTDVVCPMYTSVPKLKALGKMPDDNRPIILCEYSHSMNNSNGNIHLYWDAFWDNNLPRLQGGFIWDMIDQGLRKRTKSGKEYYGYGGDFGDVINDRQFCINVRFFFALVCTFHHIQRENL